MAGCQVQEEREGRGRDVTHSFVDCVKGWKEGGLRNGLIRERERRNNWEG